jgi:Family of unknown function (DUF5677)
VAWEWLNSIHCLIAYDYCLGAMTLCRNLFELLIAGTMSLIESPNKLQDFVDYGKMVAYEIVEATAQNVSGTRDIPAPSPEYLQAFRAKADYDNVRKRFGNDKWHGKSIKTLVENVGTKALYDSFYKEASAITHGDAYITLGYKQGQWQFSGDVRSWSHYGEVALEISLVSMATLYHRAVHRLKLPFVPDIQAVRGQLARPFEAAGEVSHKLNREFAVGDKVQVKLYDGRVVDATVRAVVDQGEKLQVAQGG